MYIHKYKNEGLDIYLVSPQATKPSTITLHTSEWAGRHQIQPNTSTLKNLTNLSFTHTDKIEEKGKTAVTEPIRRLALTLDPIAAVLVAHLKVSPIPHVELAAKEIGELKDVNEEGVQDILTKSSLTLKSTSPDALKNLVSNLKKIEA